MTARVAGRAVLLAALAAAWGCARGEASPPRAADSARGSPRPVSAPRRAPARIDSEPGALRTVVSAPVVGRTGPGGKPFEVALRTARGLTPHARRFGQITLDITLRRTSRSTPAARATSARGP